MDAPDPRLSLIQGDLSEPDQLDGVRGQTFDRILFLASLAYAADQARSLRAARDLLAPGGQIIVQRSHPIRYAVERMESNGSSLGAEYYSTAPNGYQSSWNPSVTISHPAETVSSMLDTSAAAGLHIAEVIEPMLSDEMAARFPHKLEQVNTWAS